MHSAWSRNECTVARTSLVVRRFTQITLTVRVTLKAMPLTSSTPAPPMRASGATASTTRPSIPMKHVSAYTRRATPTLSRPASTMRSATKPAAEEQMPKAVYHSTGSLGKPRLTSCLGNSLPTRAAPLMSIVATKTSRTSWSRRARLTPSRKIESDALHRCSRVGQKLRSVKRADEESERRHAGCTGYLVHLFGKSHCKSDRAYPHWLQIDVQPGKI